MTQPVLLQCGCASSARTPAGAPVCAIHAPDPAAYQPVSTSPDLSNRRARCAYFSTCRREEPSNLELAFFVFKGVDSVAARESCQHCAFYECAHRAEHMARLVRNRDGSRRPTVVEAGECPGFEPHGPYDFDEFYCGCRGWD